MRLSAYPAGAASDVMLAPPSTLVRLPGWLGPPPFSWALRVETERRPSELPALKAPLWQCSGGKSRLKRRAARVRCSRPSKVCRTGSAAARSAADGSATAAPDERTFGWPSADVGASSDRTASARMLPRAERLSDEVCCDVTHCHAQATRPLQGGGPPSLIVRRVSNSMTIVATAHAWSQPSPGWDVQALRAVVNIISVQYKVGLQM